jgi:hypothetical protein
MNLDEEIIKNFIDHFTNSEVSIDLSNGDTTEGKVLNVEVTKRVESPHPIYGIKFDFVPNVQETKVRITGR